MKFLTRNANCQQLKLPFTTQPSQKGPVIFANLDESLILNFHSHLLSICAQKYLSFNDLVMFNVLFVRALKIDRKKEARLHGPAECP